MISSHSDITKLSDFIKSAESFQNIDQDSYLPSNKFDSSSVITIPFSSGTTGNHN